MTQSRRLSGVERLWLVAERLHSPFVNQMIVEGDGVPEANWQSVIENAAAMAPMLRARLHGHLWRSRWIADGPLPTVEIIADSTWDGNGPAGAPFLDRTLDLRTGPACGVVVVPGDPTRIIFRTHHALSDGRGTVLLAERFFAALRGDTIPNTPLGPENDYNLVTTHNLPTEKIPPSQSRAPQGDADHDQLTTTWFRVRIAGRASKLVPRLIVALAGIDPTPPDQPFWVIVPADMRRFEPDNISSANMTGMIRIPAHDLIKLPDPIGAISDHIRESLRSGADAGIVRKAQFARFLPIRFMAFLAKLDARRALRQGRYGSSAIVSNVGMMDLTALTAPGFSPRHVYWVPPGNPGLPAFVGISGDPDGVEVTAMVPTALASAERNRILIESIEALFSD